MAKHCENAHVQMIPGLETLDICKSDDKSIVNPSKTKWYSFHFSPVGTAFIPPAILPSIFYNVESTIVFPTLVMLPLLYHLLDAGNINSGAKLNFHQ